MAIFGCSERIGLLGLWAPHERDFKGRKLRIRGYRPPTWCIHCGKTLYRGSGGDTKEDYDRTESRRYMDIHQVASELRKSEREYDETHR